MTYTFKLNQAALKREYSVYVVVAKTENSAQLYVGKTGDNREGCNPIISRCGNHFSYNKIHSQIRNKMYDHENLMYTYIFDHFGQYPENSKIRRGLIDLTNEMERFLNQEVMKLASKYHNCTLVNEYLGKSWISKSEKIKRAGYRSAKNKAVIDGIVSATKKVIDGVCEKQK